MNLVWLRKDLRLQDHPALKAALDNGKTQLLFIDTEKQWVLHNESKISIEFRRRRVNSLKSEATALGITVDVLNAEDFKDIPDVLKTYCIENSIQNVYFTKETPWDESMRDEQALKKLNQQDIQVHALAYDLFVSQPVFNLSGLPFKVFTPFYKKWMSMLDSVENWQRYKIKPTQKTSKTEPPYSSNSSFDKVLENYPTSSLEIKEILNQFCETKIFNYQLERDYPNLESTSRLSAYLTYGMIGPRQLLTAIKTAHDARQTEWKTDFWLRELAWRDFYRQLMIHFPRINKNLEFKKIDIKWNNNPQNVEAWKNGMTGFPIIDAAMRQLNQTGWMHNRLRMLTASFFTKLMFEDWRLGEQYFMQTLIDGEFSANNGGWQWSASTGCDAAPYFRVFNPTAQSEKFDKDGEFIKRFVPELRVFNSKNTHNPNSMERNQCNYPQPIIDYKSARLAAIDAFRK